MARAQRRDERRRGILIKRAVIRVMPHVITFCDFSSLIPHDGTPDNVAILHGRVVTLEMVRRMLIVPPDQSVRDLMRTMRRSRRHMALVRTAEGRLLGEQAALVISRSGIRLRRLVGSITETSLSATATAPTDPVLK